MKRFLILAVFAVAGCASKNTEADFLCEAQIGSPCTTIAEADGGGSHATRPVTESAEDSLADGLSSQPLLTGKFAGQASGMSDGGNAYQSARYRVPEVVGRLWIAPYLDENEILHESRFVHFVVAEPRWVQR